MNGRSSMHSSQYHNYSSIHHQPLIDEPIYMASDQRSVGRSSYNGSTSQHAMPGRRLNYKMGGSRAWCYHKDP
uniref:Uncharacterized protein n=1 Tax=Oryza meridionalis TaxID=40149 RepID=A0A0E0F5Z7_9ORYZ